MQPIVDYAVTPGGNFMKQSACASISGSPTLLGCFIVMILYRKISEKSREEGSVFAKYAECSDVIHGVPTHPSPQLCMNAPHAERPSEQGTRCTN